MSFDDDNRGADFRRPPITIKFTHMATGEEFARIELPELVISHAEITPEWLARCEREKNDSAGQVPTQKE
jgi:hypothetical protein